MSELIKSAIKAAIVVTETTSGKSSRDAKWLLAIQARILQTFKTHHDRQNYPHEKYEATVRGKPYWEDSKNSQGYWVANLGRIFVDLYGNSQQDGSGKWTKDLNSGKWELTLLFKDGSQGYILDGFYLKWVGDSTLVRALSVSETGIASKVSNGNALGEYIYNAYKTKTGAN